MPVTNHTLKGVVAHCFFDFNYWLRGGIIFSIIVPLVFLLWQAVIDWNAAPTAWDGILGIAMIIVFLTSFIIGAFIGWIYGKVKSRRTNELAGK